ncbi:hypothetical protein AAFF_G00376730 [Aldrovandia affinis]|uniref:Uncharacterized protein n=1 Tax=Aldrovandia affinis TaxID=143900 RepID=A0AAD7SFL8_9TELE|nr:hypothetical protein AAFF_G00376730 [Aldrovandia affinis]
MSGLANIWMSQCLPLVSSIRRKGTPPHGSVRAAQQCAQCWTGAAAGRASEEGRARHCPTDRKRTFTNVHGTERPDVSRPGDSWPLWLPQCEMETTPTEGSAS